MTTNAVTTAAVPPTTGTIVSTGRPCLVDEPALELCRLRGRCLGDGAVDELVDGAGQPQPDLFDLVDQLVGLGLAHVCRHGSGLRSLTRIGP